MKYLLLVVFAISTISSSFAQHGKKSKPEQRMEQIESHKVAFITTHVGLTPEEAEQFWPVYNQFNNQKKEIEKSAVSHFKDKPDIANMTDKEVNQIIEDRFLMDQERVKLDTEYFDKFKAVLPIKKVFRYYESEMLFRRQLLEKIRNHPKEKHQPKQ